MKKMLFILFVCFNVSIHAQQFISSGMIEFEVRVNNHKAFANSFFAQMFKDKLPQFSTSWYQYTFDQNRSIYKFDRKDEKTKLPWQNRYEEDNIWYNNYENGIFTNQKIIDDTYILSDSLMKIEWKLSPNETREIAGFNCRKATGIIFDSVYVFAFYTDEIAISGGPMSIHGLPGMILGITIPRMYTSWIATKLQVNAVNTKIVAAPQKGKKKKANELKETVERIAKDWGSYGQQMVWNLFL